MKFRNNTFLLMMLMMVSSLSLSQSILPSSLNEKVYIFFADEIDAKTKNPADHKKEQKYLVTYSPDEYYMVHLGTDNLYQGNYEYTMKKGYHNNPWGIVGHNIHMNDEHDMFHLVMIPHDSMSGMYIILGYKKKAGEDAAGGSNINYIGMAAPEPVDNTDCKDCQAHMNCKDCKDHMSCTDLMNCEDHKNCKDCNDHMNCMVHMNCKKHMDCKDHMKCKILAVPIGPLKPTGTKPKPTGTKPAKVMKKNFFMHSGTYKRLF